MKHSSERIDSLTSMRFFAAAMIVSLHGLGRGLGIAWTNDFALAQGVSFFFVLSGFVLAYNHPELASWDATKQFYRARIARIWPCHIAATIVLIVLVPGTSYFSLPANLRIEITAAYIFLLHGWIPSAPFILAYNTVAWSVSTEFFFYLCFPILLASWQRTWKFKLILLGSLTLSVWCIASRLSVIPEYKTTADFLVYINPLSRVTEFFLGMTAAKFYQKYADRRALSSSFIRDSLIEVAGVVIVLASLFISKRISGYLILRSSIPEVWSLITSTTGIGIIVFPIFILAFAFTRGIVTKVLSARPLTFLGEVSFALYLTHTIFLLYRQQAASLFYELPQNVVIVMYWACGLLSAMLLHFLVELPSMQLLRSRSKPDFQKSARRVFKLVLFLMVLSGAFFFQPSVRSSVATAPKSTKLFEGAVDFASGDRLRSIYLADGHDGEPLSIKFVWESLVQHRLNKFVAVHLLDANGAMVSQKDFIMETGIRYADKGSQWINTVPISSADLLSVKRMGVALYNSSGLDQIQTSSCPTDWNGSRVLINTSDHVDLLN